MTKEVVHLNDRFYVEKLGEDGYQSYDSDRNPLILANSQNDCIYWSDRFLAAKQDGWGSNASVLNDGKVGGKL